MMKYMKRSIRSFLHTVESPPPVAGGGDRFATGMYGAEVEAKEDNGVVRSVGAPEEPESDRWRTPPGMN